MKYLAFFVLLVFLCNYSESHPLCNDGSNPVPSPSLQYCKQYSSNSCCDAAREQSVVSEWVTANSSLFSTGFSLSNNATWNSCDKKLLELACLHCSFAEYHLFETYPDQPIVCNDWCVSNLSSTCGFNSSQVCVNSYASSDPWCYPVVTPLVPVSSRGLVNAHGTLRLPGPIDYRFTKNDPSGYYVALKSGQITRIQQVGQDWVAQTNPYLLDLSDVINEFGELGLLGMAFDPNYGVTNCYLWVFYTRKAQDVNENKLNQLSRFWVDTCLDNNLNNDKVDRTTECVHIKINKQNAWHNGGHTHFDGAGNLWLSLGDGGTQNDNNGDSQNPHTPLGKILRINPGRPADPHAANACQGANNYTIPTGNIYANNPQSGFPEICASGFRNPWCTFFAPDGKFYVGDVGQVRYEEVSQINCGENGGWNRFEGDGVFSNYFNEAAALNATGTYKRPIFDYRHSYQFELHPRTVPNLIGSSLTYAGIYNGKILPQKYRNGNAHLFADYYHFKISVVFDNGANFTPAGEDIIYDTPPIARYGVDRNNETIFLSFAYGEPVELLKFAPVQMPLCGNYLCESGEDCSNCPLDCPGVQTGPASQKYCCGDGVCKSGNCQVSCDGTVPPTSSNPKNGYCESDENCYNAPYDCPWHKSPGGVGQGSWCCFGSNSGPLCASPYDPNNLNNLTFDSAACQQQNDPCKKGNRSGPGWGFY